MLLRSDRLLIGLAFVAMLGAATNVSAQVVIPPGRRQMVGVVRDGNGAALQGVQVAVPGSNARTDARGAFQLLTADFDTVTISLKHVGFEPIEALLGARNGMWDTVVVQMDRSAQRLSDVNVTDTRTRGLTGLKTFEERKARGIGQFITRADIIERGSSRLSDMLRTKRGVNVVRGRVRFAAYTGSRSTLCIPDVWLDGTRSIAMEIDELAPNTVEAMELYTNFSTVPIEFQRVGANTTPCGTIVVWTRIPNGKQP
ncbi:MAG: hypothetical protein KA154_11700 [Gemmatimonadaceae bacterium]|jgi:hypothetical protein|nr:hypothetical protein [Gemmatimonadaceae bacterium]MCC6431516.1 hypothetical protein [Gemmatimonadaceae bacterium]